MFVSVEDIYVPEMTRNGLDVLVVDHEKIENEAENEKGLFGFFAGHLDTH